MPVTPAISGGFLGWLMDKINYIMGEMKFLKFFDQVKQEAKKVFWPSKKELVASSAIVFISVLIFSLLIMVLDYTIHNVINFLLNIGK